MKGDPIDPKALQRSLCGHPAQKRLAVVVTIIEAWLIAAKWLAWGPLVVPVLAESLAEGPFHLKLAGAGLYPFQTE